VADRRGRIARARIRPRPPRTDQTTTEIGSGVFTVDVGVAPLVEDPDELELWLDEDDPDELELWLDEDDPDELELWLDEEDFDELELPLDVDVGVVVVLPPVVADGGGRRGKGPMRWTPGSSGVSVGAVVSDLFTASEKLSNPP
jgi:hypothetical protein